MQPTEETAFASSIIAEMFIIRLSPDEAQSRTATKIVYCKALSSSGDDNASSQWVLLNSTRREVTEVLAELVQHLPLVRSNRSLFRPHTYRLRSSHLATKGIKQTCVECLHNLHHLLTCNRSCTLCPLLRDSYNGLQDYHAVGLSG